jgi:hypothetical protein
MSARTYWLQRVAAEAEAKRKGRPSPYGSFAVNHPKYGWITQDEALAVAKFG